MFFTFYINSVSYPYKSLKLTDTAPLSDFNVNQSYFIRFKFLKKLKIICKNEKNQNSLGISSFLAILNQVCVNGFFFHEIFLFFFFFFSWNLWI